MASSDSFSSAESVGKGKTISSRISPRKSPLMNEGFSSGEARWGRESVGAEAVMATARGDGRACDAVWWESRGKGGVAHGS